jgi:hypothetical protein
VRVIEYWRRMYDKAWDNYAALFRSLGYKGWVYIVLDRRSFA